MLIKKILPFVFAFTMLSFYANAQVTNSSISGVVVSEKNEPLMGASVTVTYEPTGTKYTLSAKKGGRFDLSNIPPGGPYTIKATFIGNADFVKSDVNIPLGEKFDIKIELSPTSKTLEGVTVAGRKSVAVKTGASTNFSRRQIGNTPNVGRTITNVTRLTPQSNGNSFAGMNYRYNNITIDGSVFNNNFGRGGEGLVPGGASPAISIDAIDQIQVNIAPFDVRQAGFVGGGINAVTKRGTNTWGGTAFLQFRNKNLIGRKVGDQEIAVGKSDTKIYGASIGGPIIKDKLFIFANFEAEKRQFPGQTWLAKRPGENDGNPQVTPVLASDLDALKAHIIQKYNYDPGVYEGYDFETDNLKFLGRLDWIVNKNHRVTLRYSQSETNDDDQINTSSVSGVTANRINNGRRGGTNGGLGFSGSNFKNNNTVVSGVFELNSNISSRVSNQLIASYTKTEPKRVPNVDAPFVDIMKDANNVYASFGTDLFSYKNFIKDVAYNVSNNVTATLGKHVVTGGVSFEYMTFQNSFASAGGPSYYRFNSLQDFLDDKAPSVFAVTYDPNNRTAIKPAEANFAQLGIYLQDVWSASNKFQLTYGLRIDKPFYTYDAPRNQALESVVFKDENGVDESFDVSQWPESKVLFSPRVGFTYDAEGDKSLIIRGGTGLFTGRIPFIWLVNQVGDNGVIRALYQPTGTALSAIRYNTDRTEYIPDPPPAVGATIPSGSSYSAAAKDFKMPQVWRSNLAFDKKLSQSITVSMEAIYSRVINNVYFRNANLGSQNGTLGGSLIEKPYYNQRLNSGIGQMIVMDNINKGASFALTASIQKSFSKGWEASLAYTFTHADEVAIGTSDQSASGFNTNNMTFNPNQPDLGFSNFSIPHRIIATGSKRFEYGNKKQFATTIGMVYSAGPQERYTFRYGADINGDGQSNDVIYVPKDPSEIKFIEGFKVGTKVYTAQEQSDAFFNFIDGDKALTRYKGKYLYKYSGLLPWVGSWDARILQDIGVVVNGKKHTLQLSADIVNVLNLLNRDWGERNTYTFGTFQDMGLLGTPTSGSSTNNTGNEAFNRTNPKFTFNPDGPTKAYQKSYTVGSTWNILLGVRYIF
jgi:hypothetical protein